MSWYTLAFITLLIVSLVVLIIISCKVFIDYNSEIEVLKQNDYNIIDEIIGIKLTISDINKEIIKIKEDSIKKANGIIPPLQGSNIK